MKRILLTAIIAVFFTSVRSQTTATNFNVNDCSGVNHDLFTELDSGKVVVLVWVMPCGGCIAPALAADNEVQNYVSTHPGRVALYICDDDGGTSCAALSSWVNSIGVSHGATLFSDSLIKMTDYGSPGMPKVVVLGGSGHTIFYNENVVDSLELSSFNNAINQALVTGIEEDPNTDLLLSVYPNPFTGPVLSISYTLDEASEVLVEIYLATGIRIKSIPLGKQIKGNHEALLNVEHLAQGSYFLKLSSGGSTGMYKLIVTELQ